MKSLNKVELLNKLKDKYNDNWPSEIAEGFQMAVDIVEDAPTMEAIFIEWIKKWVETCGNEPVDNFTDVDYYCDGYQKNVIECLLRAWEKENEVCFL